FNKWLTSAVTDFESGASVKTIKSSAHVLAFSRRKYMLRRAAICQLTSTSGSDQVACFTFGRRLDAVVPATSRRRFHLPCDGPATHHHWGQTIAVPAGQTAGSDQAARVARHRYASYRSADRKSTRLNSSHVKIS